MKNSRTDADSVFETEEIRCLRNGSGFVIIDEQTAPLHELTDFEVAKWILLDRIYLRNEDWTDPLCFRLTNEIIATMPIGIECRIPLAVILEWLGRDGIDVDNCLYETAEAEKIKPYDFLAKVTMN